MMIFVPEIPIGKKFGRLTVLGMGHRSATSRQWYWKCRCDCGTEKEIMGCNIRAGVAESCGCLQKERASKANKVHGKSRTKTHTAWKNIKQRCLNPKNNHFHDYGGRGIKICDKWKNSFAAFDADIGIPPSPEHTLDRIDNNGNYEPGNVRWVTGLDQIRNRRVSVYIEMDGRKHLKQTCDDLGVDYFRAYDMIIRRKIQPNIAFEILKGSKEPPVTG
jgi:hypothetical protein